MNSKHQKTLAAISTTPTSGNIEWRKIESLIIALGATVIEGNGSRVSFVLNNEKVTFIVRIPAKRPSATKLGMLWTF